MKLLFQRLARLKQNGETIPMSAWSRGQSAGLISITK